MTKLHDFTATSISGAETDLSQYEGKAVLVVNTASKCGFTPQYEGLEKLYEQYADQGLVILGFPCDQFGHQEPGEESEIEEFCQLNYGVTFPMFAKVDVNGAEAHPLLALIGPEPLGNWFDETYLVARLKDRNTPIKSALLDQHLVAGLGNIYVCETLYRARISPAAKARDLTKHQAAALVPIIRQVLTDAINAGGSSLRDYRQADGELGYFQHSFQVYGREGQPCQSPGCHSTVARMVQSGRSSFYCPTCQT